MSGLIIIFCIVATRVGGERRLDTPSYIHKMQVLNGYQEKQSHYVKSVFRMPMVAASAGLSRFPFGAVKEDLVLLWPKVLPNGVKLAYAIGNIVDDSFNSSRSGMLMVYPKNNASEGYEYGIGSWIGDPRLWIIDGQLKVVVWQNRPGNSKLQHEIMANIFLDSSRSQLYVTHWTELRLGFEEPTHTEKNWTPFVYINQTGSTRREEQLYVYWLQPHKIIRPVDSNNSDQLIVCSFFCSSEAQIPSSDKPLWEFGPPHGGTNALLIDTQFGQRYLSIFHSQGKFLDPFIRTYYFGGYLFEPAPPFRMTHMTPDPIIPQLLYNESTSGWAYRAMDYILFPIGLHVANGLVYITLGRHDREGWVVVFNQTSFVASMRSVDAKVL